MEKKSVEKIVLEFLESTIDNQGNISIQNLTGHFSQLPVDIRKKFNCTKTEVKKFLLAYPEIFIVNDDIVSISPKKEPLNLVDSSIQCEIPTSVDINDGGEDVTEKRTMLNNCKGTVIKKFDMYGFIEYSSPMLTTTIYFDVSCFEDGQSGSFQKLKLNEEVNFSAKQSFGHKAEYRATKVWRCGSAVPLQGSEKCYSSSTSLASQDSCQSDTLSGAGIVMKITANYGFIKPNEKTQGNVFFFRTKLQLPGIEEIKNLEDIISKGDVLYFLAIPSKKKNADAPWEATKVSRTHIENARSGLPKHFDKSILHTGSASSSDCSFVSSGFDADKVMDENHIYDQSGIIQELASNEPIIQFDNNKVAVVLPNVVYKDNKIVEEPGWELNEDAKVQFNAECVNSKWRATLVWIGEKPVLATNRKKSHKKKNTNVKESTVSDLCEISLYDDEQSDEGIWHTPSHIDTNTWDKEDSENWPALEPPLLSKSRLVEQTDLSCENILKVPKREVSNTISSKNIEKHNNEAGHIDNKGIDSTNNSKKSQQKKGVLNTSGTTASSKYFDQNDSGSEAERLKRYKMNNGWEEDSFNTKSEKWPALNESLITKPSGIFKGGINEYQHLAQEQATKKLDYFDSVDFNNELQENYYSDEETLDLISDEEETVSDIAYNKNLTVVNSLNSVPQKVRYNKFSDVPGTVINIQKYFAFIKYSKSDPYLIFCWEQAFCDGQLVSKYYTDLHKVYHELDQVTFTYCCMTDENGKEWTNVLQVWKGGKPSQLTAEYIMHNEVDSPISSFNTAKTEPTPISSSENIITATKFSTVTLPTANVIPNIHSVEDCGVSVENTEIHEDNTKSLCSLSNLNSSAPKPSAVWQRGNEIETEMKSYAPSSINSGFLAAEQKADDGSFDKETVTTCDAVSNFFNNVLGLAQPKKSEFPCYKELAPHILPESTCLSSLNKETQTEITACEEGTQTFVTGTILSVAVFPQ